MHPQSNYVVVHVSAWNDSWWNTTRVHESYSSFSVTFLSHFLHFYVSTHLRAPVCVYPASRILNSITRKVEEKIMLRAWLSNWTAEGVHPWHMSNGAATVDGDAAERRPHDDAVNIYGSVATPVHSVAPSSQHVDVGVIAAVSLVDFLAVTPAFDYCDRRKWTNWYFRRDNWIWSVSNGRLLATGLADGTYHFCRILILHRGSRFPQLRATTRTFDKPLNIIPITIHVTTVQFKDINNTSVTRSPKNNSLIFTTNVLKRI